MDYRRAVCPVDATREEERMKEICSKRQNLCVIVLYVSGGLECGCASHEQCDRDRPTGNSRKSLFLLNSSTIKRIISRHQAISVIMARLQARNPKFGCAEIYSRVWFLYTYQEWGGDSEYLGL